MNKNGKISLATKWSTITEIVAKLVTPVSNMFLARLLTPDAFGVVATATMIFSFAEMFTDAGFQKYLIQHDFNSDEDKEKAATIAFWTNITMSCFFWSIIILFNEQLANAVGNPGLGIVFIVSCVSLPLNSLSSVQMALYRRSFDFKTLFFVRLIAVIIPLIVTVPIAFFTRSYWAIIIGTICGNVSNAIILTWKSDWKPRKYYSFKILKEMLSFSIWSLIEAIIIWLTNYIGVFLVGKYLSSYYLGIYKTSMNTVNQILNLITASTTNVLFVALSREQNNKQAFEKIFFMFQRNVGLLVIPMGIGIFLYREMIVDILLGDQWGEAANFIGLWALINALKIVLSNYCSEAYRALGKPKVSVFVQSSQLIILIPMLMYGAQRGFETLYIMRCLVSVELIIVNLIIVKVMLGISSVRMIKNTFPEIMAAIGMIPISIVLKQMYDGYVWNIFSIVICGLIYFLLICIFPSSRKWFIPLLNNCINKIRKRYSIH